MDIIFYWACLPLITLLLGVSAMMVLMTTDNDKIRMHTDIIMCVSQIVVIMSVVIGVILCSNGEKITIHLTTAAEKKQVLDETYQSLIEAEKQERTSNAED